MRVHHHSNRKGHSDMTTVALKSRPRPATVRSVARDPAELEITPRVAPRVALVANEKGGVGKSVFTRTLVDHLRANGTRVAAYDADGSVGATVRVLGSRDLNGSIERAQNPV
jgi:Mrp family chromosome partitioning ATPase